jgi:hypothetical protein
VPLIQTHGSGAVRRLGTPASQRCVRLSPDNATKLFGLDLRTSRCVFSASMLCRTNVAGIDPPLVRFAEEHAELPSIGP